MFVFLLARGGYLLYKKKKKTRTKCISGNTPGIDARKNARILHTTGRKKNKKKVCTCHTDIMFRFQT